MEARGVRPCPYPQSEAASAHLGQVRPPLLGYSFSLPPQHTHLYSDAFVADTHLAGSHANIWDTRSKSGQSSLPSIHTHSPNSSSGARHQSVTMGYVTHPVTVLVTLTWPRSPGHTSGHTPLVTHLASLPWSHIWSHYPGHTSGFTPLVTHLVTLPWSHI